MLAHRSQDPVIAVYQDNDKRDIVICDANDAALQLLGFDTAEVKNQSLGRLLPERIFKLLNEYVEYQPDGNDVGSVLNKVSSFCIINKQGQELDFRVKIARTTPIGGHDQFALMLIANQTRRNEAFRLLLKENFKGHEVLDEKTGLPERNSMIKDVEFVLFYVLKNELQASIAIIELDGFEELNKAHKPETIAAVFKHIAQLCKQNLRADDTIGFLEPKRLGLILFDTAGDSARMVLNRLRWLIAAHPFKAHNTSIQLSVKIAYHCLTQNVEEKESLGKLEILMDKDILTENSIQEIVNDDEI